MMNATAPQRVSSRLLAWIIIATAVIAVLAANIFHTSAFARFGDQVHPIIVPGYLYGGNASCNTSGCHGDDAAVTHSGQNIGDEGNIWADHDPHAKAFRTLSNNDSKAMAAKLNIADATASSRCLTCHATDAPKAQQGELFDLRRDAVGCESCHGPGEKYLNPHAAERWTAEQRAAVGSKGLLDQFGLIDTNNLEVRANTCVACHLQIDKDLVDAGHPPLSFEMYMYNYYSTGDYHIHWDEPLGQGIDARLWATGQVAARTAARAQVAAWKAKGWDTADADALLAVYGAGVEVAKKHFGSDSISDLAKATVTADKAAAAAADLAAAAAVATTPIQRQIFIGGLAALGSAAFDLRGVDAPDAFWEAYTAAGDAEGDAFTAALNQMAQYVK